MELIKVITTLILLTLSIGLSAQVNWYTFEEAFEAQKIDPKPIMVDAYTIWCCLLYTSPSPRDRH